MPGKLKGEALTAYLACRCRIREALTSERTAVERDSPENARRVQQLNAFLVDFVSLLWQKKLLDQDDDGGTAKPQVGLTSYVGTHRTATVRLLIVLLSSATGFAGSKSRRSVRRCSGASRSSARPSG